MAHERPDLILLLETKNKENVIFRVRRQLKFKNSFVVNPIGIGRGLAVLWNDEVEIKVESSSQEMINLIWGDHESRIKMRVTIVHAPNPFRDRLKL